MKPVPFVICMESRGVYWWRWT